MTDSKATNPKDSVGVRKAPMSTVPAGVLAEVGVAMLEGAAKYGRHNYRVAGVQASVYYDATMRHLMGWWEGEDIDPDSGMSHITKAITSLVVLRDAMLQGMCADDRPPQSPAFYQGLNDLAGEILDRHADKKPTHYTQSMAAAPQVPDALHVLAACEGVGIRIKRGVVVGVAALHTHAASASQNTTPAA